MILTSIVGDEDSERAKEQTNVCKYVYMYLCVYVWSSHIAEYGSTG